ncbi:hypothetical protein GWK47_007387 [Chionoecetes opilio]|uniref:Uncharacterized protein n=1 Tax=Chionoecetes opilio TaxID=41210 RepID=A0A8J4Y281_CHIOP|nr:hypothetical protein GWK47_007387 [Chionoecetes opilio]
MTTATGGHEFAGTRYSETVFCSRGGPVPLLHFHDTVHVRAFTSYVTPKSFSSTSLCKAVAAAVTTSDSSIPNFTSSNERTVTPRKACIPFIPITKSKPSGLVRITSALIVTDGPESSWTCTSPIPIHSQRSPPHRSHANVHFLPTRARGGVHDAPRAAGVDKDVTLYSINKQPNRRQGARYRQSGEEAGASATSPEPFPGHDEAMWPSCLQLKHARCCGFHGAPPRPARQSRA